MEHKQNYRIYYGSASEDLEKLADRLERLMKTLPAPQYHKVLNILAYRHPWRPKHVGWTNALDQLLHALYAVAVLLPVLLCASYATAGMSGFALGVIREWEQWKELDLKILMIWDRLQDAAFFAVGGLVLYFLKTIFLH